MPKSDSNVITLREELKNLDDRIADAFEASLSSTALADLLREVEQTSADAQVTSKAAEARALDPKLRTADVDTARKQMSDADFRAKRMDAAAAQLKDLLAKAEARERNERAANEYAAAKAERDQLAKDLVAYEEHAAAIVALLHRIAKSRDRIARANQGQSASTWLHSAEMIARRSDREFGISPDETLPELVHGVRLPRFRRDGSNVGYIWPPRF